MEFAAMLISTAGPAQPAPGVAKAETARGKAAEIRPEILRRLEFPSAPTIEQMSIQNEFSSSPCVNEQPGANGQPGGNGGGQRQGPAAVGAPQYAGSVAQGGPVNPEPTGTTPRAAKAQTFIGLAGLAAARSLPPSDAQLQSADKSGAAEPGLPATRAQKIDGKTNPDVGSSGLCANKDGSPLSAAIDFEEKRDAPASSETIAQSAEFISHAAIASEEGGVSSARPPPAAAVPSSIHEGTANARKHQLDIVLESGHLGQFNVRMQLSRGALDVVIEVARSKSFAILRGAHSTLNERLSAISADSVLRIVPAAAPEGAQPRQEIETRPETFRGSGQHEQSDANWNGATRRARPEKFESGSNHSSDFSGDRDRFV